MEGESIPCVCCISWHLIKHITTHPETVQKLHINYGIIDLK